ncbi:ureidoglycolate lyase [Pygmaiobacter massiliensis]|uniref:ureidoglycolate lyase n=1 Tax=Pygmaiobacter massiliensis TaxID=1917873 RepID=UPI002A800561|nr:ureidoglycolate lyase [Pygmaiobacter massiliensis]MDY4785002.1 ureidoglycolate hydrolase [Pygmaiobacter massiliensis]
MKSIKAVPVTHENFRPYGFIANIADPSADYAMSDTLPAFHRDMVLAPMADPAPIAFGSLKINRRPTEIRDVEYHSGACEVMMPLDDDMVIYAGPASNDVVEPEKLEAFVVPQGTLVVFRAGAWHGAPWPVHQETATVLICLPERTYLTDTVKYPLPEEQTITIELP